MKQSHFLARGGDQGETEGKGDAMQYRLKVVFVDNEELVLGNTEKHGFSDDLELFEITTAEEILAIPLKQIKYVACDAKILKK